MNLCSILKLQILATVNLNFKGYNHVIPNDHEGKGVVQSNHTLFFFI